MTDAGLQTGRLFAEAKAARENAYAPYSGFRVGAAVLCSDGTIYRGCNVENSSYGATVCAERNAVCRAVADGKRSFVALAVCAGADYCFPCGICRQFLSEFSADGSMRIFCLNGEGEAREFTLNRLLPEAFSL